MESHFCHEMAPRGAREPPDGVSPLILVVDDEPDFLTFLFDLLFTEGYRVIPFKDGMSALERLPMVNPQVILTDVRLPDMNGLELLRQVKALDPLRPVVVMSAYADQEMYDRSLALRADAFLSKPFTKADLLRTLTQVLEQRRK